MNKKFYFGLAATAALFASCSSDDLSVNEARQDVLNGDNRAAIQLLVGSPNSTTRGTGTVGGMAATDDSTDPNNKWGGQQFNVYMLNKGTLTVAKDAENRDIYNNAVFTAPNELAGVPGGTPAMEVTSTESGGLIVKSKVSYFPQEGNFDFWAYRTDGAEGDNVPAVSGETAMKLDFTIDGSQDIMTSKAVPNIEANSDGTYGEQNVKEGRIFSAYSVRRGVLPMLKFKHELARLTFKVKGSKDLCNKSADPSTSVNDTLESNPLAVRVTDIWIKSLATGKLIVAYTTTTPPTDKIEWTEGSEEWLKLQQRGVDYTPAVLAYKSCSGVSYGTITVGTKTDFDFNENTIVYPDNTTVDPKKGLPVGGFAASLAGTGTYPALASCYLCYVETEPQPGDISVNADLEALDPVAPIWKTSGSEEGEAYPTPVGEALLVAPQLNYQLTVKTIQKVAETTKTTYCTIEQAFGGTAAHTDAVVQSTMDADAYAALDDAEKGGTVDADGLVAATIQANDGKYYLNSADSKYYKIVYTAAVDPEFTYYFKDDDDAAAALTAYTAWVAASSPTAADAPTKVALDAALAKGSTTSGAKTEVLTYTWKPDTKTILLNGPSTTTGNATTYKPYKANKSYTITLSLAGMEPITGGSSNTNIGGYEVDEEGSEFNIDMDSEPGL